MTTTRFRIYIIFLCAFFVSNFAFGQIEQMLNKERLEKITVLEKKMKTNTDTKVYTQQLSDLARLYVFIKSDKAVELGKKSLQIAEKNKNKKGIATAYATLGFIYFEQKKLKQAKNTLLTAEQKLLTNKQEDDLSFIYSYIGKNYLELGDTLSAVNYYKKGLVLSEKLKIIEEIAAYNELIGYVYYYQGNLKKARHYFETALNTFKKTNLHYRIALASGNVGLCYFQMGNQLKSIEYYTQSAKEYKIQDLKDGEGWTNFMLSNIHTEIGEYDKAIEYLYRNKEIYPKSDYFDAYIEREVGKIIMTKGDLVEAEKQFEKAREIFVREAKDADKKVLYLDFALLYFKKQDYQKALTHLIDAEKYTRVSNNQYSLMTIDRLRGASLVKLNKVEEGKKDLLNALDFCLNTNIEGELPFIYEYLSLADSLLGDYRSSLENYKKYTYYSQLKNQDNFQTGKTAYQFEYEKKEAVAKAELKVYQTQLNYAIIGVVLMLLLTVVLIYLFRLRSKNIKIEKENIRFQKREIEQIRETEAFKSRFLTNITHEFRTPLTLIKGHLEILNQNANPQESSHLKKIEKSSDHLLKLINQLMELARMESHQYQLEFQQGGLSQTIIASFQAFHSLAEKKNISLKISNLSEQNFLNNFAYSKEAIMTIVSNLVSNAIKFTPENGKINVEIKDISDELLELKVSDSGIGIKAEDIKNIFDRFYQVDTPEQRTYEGSGIGLAFVKELTQLHGGNVRVEPNENGGTIFIIQLKSGKLKPNTTSLISKNIVEPNEIELIEKTITKSPELPLILVVEDQPDLRSFIVDNLDSNYRFIQASNGKEGIELAHEHSPDLIISDIMMPEMDGLTFCNFLKNNIVTSHIPIILLTAKATLDDKLDGLQLGADDYLTKPFSLVELQLRVRNVLNAREILRQKFTHATVVSQEPVFDVLNKIEQAFISKLETVIQQNMSNVQFGVPQLAENMFLSASQLTRKLKSLIEKTPAEYIRILRLENAKTLIKEGYPISESAWKSGFEDADYFRKVFKKHFGELPSSIK